jgi:hypothetical protein
VKTIVAVLFIALAGFGGRTIYLWHQRDAIPRQVEPGPVASAPSMQSAAVHLEMARIEESLAAQAPPAPAQVPGRPSMSEAMEILREQMASPESIEQARVSRKGRIYVLYPDLGKALGLSEEEESRLYSLLALQLANQRPQRNDETSIPDFARTRREKEAEIASVLDDKYSLWQEYQLEAQSWRDMSDFRAVLNAYETPLTDAREESVLRALVDERELIRQGGDLQIGHSPQNVRRYLEAVSPYLTPQQREAFQEMMERKVNTGRVLGMPG